MQTIVHLVDGDLARGAQRSAQMLVDTLDGPDRHVLATIFDSRRAVLRPDIELEVRSGRSRTSGWAPAAVRAIRNEPTIRRADLVVAHGGEALKYLVAAGPSGRIAYHKIGVLGRRFDRFASARLHRWAVSRADEIVAISSQARSELIDVLGVSPGRVTVIPNGRNPGDFVTLPRPRMAPIRLAWVGSMSRTKRPEVFVDLVEELRWRGQVFDAVMVGSGPLLAETRRRASRLDIEVPGAVDDVAAVLGASDLFVFTSVPEGEGMPGVLIEASMSGAVPVSTDVPGAADFVLDGSTGAIVAPDRPGELIDTVEAYLNDPLRLGEHAEAARRHAVEHFSTDRIAHAWQRFVARSLEEVPCVSSI